jgi:hypothetical protein
MGTYVHADACVPRPLGTQQNALERAREGAQPMPMSMHGVCMLVVVQRVWYSALRHPRSLQQQPERCSRVSPGEEKGRRGKVHAGMNRDAI